MKEVIAGLIIGIVVVFVLYLILSPYYSLWKLNDIADEVKKIREILEKGDLKK